MFAHKEKSCGIGIDFEPFYVAGLQTMCRRLSERIFVLNQQIDDRDSYVHWLLLDSDPEYEKTREEMRASLSRSVEGDEDAVRWLTAPGHEHQPSEG